MWISIPEQTQILKHPVMDEPLEVDGTAIQVKQEVGEALIEDYPAVSEHKPE